MNKEISNYLKYAETLGRSDKTVSSYAKRLERFRDSCGIRDIRTVTMEHIDSYHDSLKRSNLAPSSRFAYMVTLRAFLKWLYDTGKTFTDLSLYIELEKRTPQTLEMPLNEIETAALLEVMQPQTYRSLLSRTILELLYGCGLRRAEVARLKVGDIDFKREMLNIRGKGDKERIIPIPGAALYFLELYLKQRQNISEVKTDSLFIKQSGSPFKPSDIDNLFAKLRKIIADTTTRKRKRKSRNQSNLTFIQNVFPPNGKSNLYFKDEKLNLQNGSLQKAERDKASIARQNSIQSDPYIFSKNQNLISGSRKSCDLSRVVSKVHPHMLRHCYAVHMLRNGADVRVLQNLLGHESIDDTARYLRLVKEDVKRAYDDAMEGIL